MEVTVAERGDLVVIGLAGEFDIESRVHFHAALTGISEETSGVEIDASAVTFIDSCGISELVGLYRAVTDRGGSFRVVSSTPHFRRVIDITGLSEYFDID